MSLLNNISLSGRKEILAYLYIAVPVCIYLTAKSRLMSVYLLETFLQYLLLCTHRIAEGLRFGGASGDHMIQLPARAGSPGASCPGPCPDGFLNVSKDGESTTSLGKLCQCLVTLTMKKHFVMFCKPPVCQFVPIASGLTILSFLLHAVKNAVLSPEVEFP